MLNKLIGEPDTNRVSLDTHLSAKLKQGTPKTASYCTFLHDDSLTYSVYFEGDGRVDRLGKSRIDQRGPNTFVI